MCVQSTTHNYRTVKEVLLLFSEHDPANFTANRPNWLNGIHVFDLLVYHKKCGKQISNGYDQVHKRDYRHLPLDAIRIVHKHLVATVEYVKLQNVTDKEEWQEEAETFPHPSVKALNGDVH